MNIELTFNFCELKDNHTLYELFDMKYNKFITIYKEIDIIQKIKTENNPSFSNIESPNWFCRYFKSFIETINIFGFFNSYLSDNDININENKNEK